MDNRRPPEVSIAGGAGSIGATSTVTVTTSRTPVQNNFLFVTFGSDTARTVVTPPSGWTEVTSNPGGGGSNFMFYKVAGAGEPTSFAWVMSGSMSGGAWMILENSRVDPTPVYVEDIANDGVLRTTHTFTTYNIAEPSVAFATIRIQGTTTTISIDNNFTDATGGGFYKAAYRDYNSDAPSQVTSFTSGSRSASRRIVVFKAAY